MSGTSSTNMNPSVVSMSKVFMLDKYFSELQKLWDNEERHTLLVQAIEDENLELVKHVIDLGVDVNLEDGNGRTPLRIAIYKNNLEIITLLSKNGANLNSIDSLRWTPLTYAIEKKKNLEIVKLLVENGADINDHCGSFANAFQVAILANNLEVVEFFMENGADLTIQTRFPIQHNSNSFELAMKENKMNILKLLLNYSKE